MISFYKTASNHIIVLNTRHALSSETTEKLTWLFGDGEWMSLPVLTGNFIGPRKEMVTPWSTNAVEITQNMGISGIIRIEEFFEDTELNSHFDPMLQSRYSELDQTLFDIDKTQAPIQWIKNISAYNQSEGLALSDEEILYLETIAQELGRPLTDTEVFGFSQVNSEHCRHKIFNGTFIIDQETRKETLFQLIKKTTAQYPNEVVSAYTDNAALINGSKIAQFAPVRQDQPDYFELTDIETALSLKAETHNFPTTVEPFYGASTGSGGEIRDRMATGCAGIPLAGSAVYMTSDPSSSRQWLYQSPLDILIKASNGASDFGNKFGQPLICGSLLTFEHAAEQLWGYDKVIMLAGGVGYAKQSDSMKQTPQKHDKIVVLGGDNYRIGMGGGAVSSVATGEFQSAIELNAVQRANPEMQKRVFNVIRAMSENSKNPIISIHDHGAGGHLNCLSELVEKTGGRIDMDQLLIGDPTLSAKEILGNESQERMGLVAAEKDTTLLQQISDRERSPMVIAGEITDDDRFTATYHHDTPADLSLAQLFGKPPKTVLTDHSQPISFSAVTYDPASINKYLDQVLQLPSVASKDWLTNKVDRSVTGRSATQQTVGPLQLPLNNVAVTALDYVGYKGIATSIGHAPVSGLISPKSGSELSIVEALTNLIWAPLEKGLSGVSLSANWMWPAKNPGENARLYEAVQAASDCAIALGINIPTGKDSLSMTQKYPDGKTVYSPGTVIISTIALCSDIRKTVTPLIQLGPDTELLYVPLSKDDYHLGGSSFAQVRNQIGDQAPSLKDPAYLVTAFNTIQSLIQSDQILAGHDVSAGGLIVTLLEMAFTQVNVGLSLDLSGIPAKDLIGLLFSENPGIVIQVNATQDTADRLSRAGIDFFRIGHPEKGSICDITFHSHHIQWDIPSLRTTWFKTSYFFDRHQTRPDLAQLRFDHVSKTPLEFQFPTGFNAYFQTHPIDFNRREPTGIKAAIIREKGVNGDREMAYAMYLAGFDVKDVHMTDLIAGRETLSDIQFLVFVGGFSNSDVLGSAKGWAGAFLYNEKAKAALDAFYAREDTLSLGICNGCQLMMHLNLVTPELPHPPQLLHNESGKFESSFLSVDILQSNSVLLNHMAGSRLGIWVAHGEGRFQLGDSNDYTIPVKYSQSHYPANPNGSVANTAAICSKDGRHLAMMPHLERAFLPWQWPYYPHESTRSNAVSPWMMVYCNAREFIANSSSASHKSVF